MKKKVSLAIIITLVLLVGLAIYFKPAKITEISHNGVDIKITGGDFKQDLYNDTVYVYVPINTDMSKLKYTTIVEGNSYEDGAIKAFMSRIDTLIPGETQHILTVDGKELNISVIVE